MCFLCNSRFKSSLELMLCVIDISTLNKTYLNSRNMKYNVHTDTHSSKPFRWCNGKSVKDSLSTSEPVRPTIMKLVCCYIR